MPYQLCEDAEVTIVVCELDISPPASTERPREPPIGTDVTRTGSTSAAANLLPKSSARLPHAEATSPAR